MRSVSEIAQGAIDALNKYGWIKYEGGTPEKGFCALGAINFASTDEDEAIHYDNFKRCRDKLSSIVKYRQDIAAWNDSRKSSEEVIAALQKVIDNERNNRD